MCVCYSCTCTCCHCSLYTVRLLSACRCSSVLTVHVTCTCTVAALYTLYGFYQHAACILTVRVYLLALLSVHCMAVISMQLCDCSNCTCPCTATALCTLYGCYQHAAVHLLYMHCHCSLYTVRLLSACSCASVITVHVHILSLLSVHCMAVISMQLCVCYNCTCTATVLHNEVDYQETRDKYYFRLARNKCADFEPKKETI